MNFGWNIYISGKHVRTYLIYYLVKLRISILRMYWKNKFYIITFYIRLLQSPTQHLASWYSVGVWIWWGWHRLLSEFVSLGQEAFSQETCQQVLTFITFVIFRYGHEVTERDKFTVLFIFCLIEDCFVKGTLCLLNHRTRRLEPLKAYWLRAPTGLTLRLLMSYIYIYIWSTYSWCF